MSEIKIYHKVLDDGSHCVTLRQSPYEVFGYGKDQTEALRNAVKQGQRPFLRIGGIKEKMFHGSDWERPVDAVEAGISRESIMEIGSKLCKTW